MKFLFVCLFLKTKRCQAHLDLFPLVIWVAGNRSHTVHVPWTSRAPSNRAWQPAAMGSRGQPQGFAGLCRARSTQPRGRPSGYCKCSEYNSWLNQLHSECSKNRREKQNVYFYLFPFLSCRPDPQYLGTPRYFSLWA